jgi:hypothetical protein
MFQHPAEEHAEALKKIKALEKRIAKILQRAPLRGSLLAEEIAVGLLGMRVTEEYYLLCHRAAGRAKRKSAPPKEVEKLFRELDRRLAVVWRKRNKPSEYFRIREVIRGAERRCREFAKAS